MIRRLMVGGTATAVACMLAAAPPPAIAGAAGGPEDGSFEATGPDPCSVAPHRVQLRGTGRAPGAAGWMDLRFGSSPYGVAVTEDGSYLYELTIQVTSVPPSAGNTLVAWAATPNLDQHQRLGELGEDRRLEGEVSWNKFLVFVTAESSADVERWQGPILMTGNSPSGNMHTMAGHGIFEQHGIGC